MRRANGERYVRPKDGYIAIVIDGKHLMEHRYVWQQAFGPIPPKHDIHHKNHVRTDNRIENLELIDWLSHRRHHAPAGGRAPRSPERIAKWRATMAAKPKQPRALCSINGCGKVVNGNNYCLLHYMRFKRRGDPLAAPILQSDRALPHGEAQHHAKLTTNDIPGIRAMFAAGTSLHAIGRTFGVAPATIRDITAGKTWKHVP